MKPTMREQLGFPVEKNRTRLLIRVWPSGQMERIPILYGGHGRLYVASKRPLDRPLKPGEAEAEAAVIGDPKAAYRVNFREHPLYLEKGDESTILTQQKIESMEPNSILGDWEKIYGIDLQYPIYIERLRTGGSAYANNSRDFPTGPLLAGLVESYLRV